MVALCRHVRRLLLYSPAGPEGGRILDSPLRPPGQTRVSARCQDDKRRFIASHCPTAQTNGECATMSAPCRKGCEVAHTDCQGLSGAMQRREFLRAGLAGFTSLSLPVLMRLRAARGAADPGDRTAVILVWLRGGASHLETYDPKPEAGSDYRGPYAAIATRTPGLFISELL